MAEHDNSYKLLVSHARMVEDLLHGFVKEEWVDQLDFTSLEKVSGSYVSDDIRDREDGLPTLAGTFFYPSRSHAPAWERKLDDPASRIDRRSCSSRFPRWSVGTRG